MTLFAHTMPSHVSHYTLRVKNMAVMTQYYQSVIGLSPITTTPSQHALGIDGVPLVTLTNTPDAIIAPHSETGLFHAAFLVPTRKDLANILYKFAIQRMPIDGASDHLVSEALYLQDPEGNGIEIYVDRPREDWPFDKDGVVMDTLRLDIDGLLSLADKTPITTMPKGTRLGHLHLKVDYLEDALAFYHDILHQEVQETYPGAYFLATGDYHHHIAINTWQSAGHKPDTTKVKTGLDELTLTINDKNLFDNIIASLKTNHMDYKDIETDKTIQISSPWGYNIIVSLQ